MNDQRRRYTILVVEDDPNHRELVKIVFAHMDEHAFIHTVNTAEEAIDYLRGPWPDADFGQPELPDVIVLDVLMPGMGGVGFLEWYAGQEQLAHVPVIVFTSSKDPELVQKSFALGAREFVPKPTDFRELVKVVLRVLDRWTE